MTPFYPHPASGDAGSSGTRGVVYTTLSRITYRTGRRLEHLYELRRKTDTLEKVNRFIAHVSAVDTPGCFRMDDGGEFVSLVLTKVLHREYTAQDTRKQKAVAENAIWRVMKANHAALLRRLRLFLKADFGPFLL